MSEARATLSGALRVGEASAAMRDLQFRIHGSMLGFYAALAALLAAFTVGGYFIVSALLPGQDWGALLGLAVGYLVYARFVRPLTIARFRDRFTARGLPLEMPMRIDIGSEALTSELGGVKRIVEWQVVTELFHSHGYWIFIAQADSIFAPERHFASLEEQRAFVAAALSHMSEAARTRSAYAVAFASGGH